MALTLLAQPVHLRLNTDAIAVPALTSQVRPALVLPERAARALLDAAETADALREGGQSLAGEVLAVSVTEGAPAAPLAAHPVEDLDLTFWLRVVD